MSSVQVVTGAASGMGAAAARRLAGRGPLVLVDSAAAPLDGLADALARTGAEVRAVAGDIRRAETLERVGHELVDTGDPLGAVVHAAGLSPTMSDWASIVEVNLVASARLLDALDPLVTEGSVAVLLASQAAHLVAAGGPPPNGAALDAVLDDPLGPDLIDRLLGVGTGMIDDPGGAYGWSKRGVLRLAVRAAARWGPRGGRVVSLSPGIIDTPMGRREYERQPYMASIVEATPLGRTGRPDDIAAVVEFLCSEGAAFVTGIDILVDGGSTGALLALVGGSAPGPEQ